MPAFIFACRSPVVQAPLVEKLFFPFILAFDQLSKISSVYMSISGSPVCSVDLCVYVMLSPRFVFTRKLVKEKFSVSYKISPVWDCKYL